MNYLEVKTVKMALSEMRSSSVYFSEGPYAITTFNIVTWGFEMTSGLPEMVSLQFSVKVVIDFSHKIFLHLIS